MDFRDRLIASISPIESTSLATGPERKNYTEKLSREFSLVVAEELRRLGLDRTVAPTGRDKQFMGGYGPKGVDVYLSDEKHGLLLTSGIKGILFTPRKNIKNRYRDMVMEALELHKRFPYAVCGHFFFMGKRESLQSSQKFGNTVGEAVALLSSISGRRRPDEAPELYETIGIALIEPGQPETLELAPADVPKELQAETYCARMVERFHTRNPFYE